MVDDDDDAELFERIPWEALENRGDRRWAVYLAAIVVVLAAVGVTIGRGWSPGAADPSPPKAGVTTSVFLPTSTRPPSAAPPVVTTPEISTTWSEADLMAVPAPTLEEAAAAAAEWFVVDFFTRDGTGEAPGRSFVEWATVIDRRWRGEASMELVVAVHRLAAEGAEPYRRIPPEAWMVTADLADEGWVIVEGPVSVPVIEPKAEIGALGDPVPPEVASLVTDAGIRGGREAGGVWLVEVDWTDAAGLEWIVVRRVEG